MQAPKPSPLVTKAQDENYEAVRGHVLKPLAKRFQQYCIDSDLDYSEGLEAVLTDFFARLDTSSSSKQQPKRKEV